MTFYWYIWQYNYHSVSPTATSFTPPKHLLAKTFCQWIEPFKIPHDIESIDNKIHIQQQQQHTEKQRERQRQENRNKRKTQHKETRSKSHLMDGMDIDDSLSQFAFDHNKIPTMNHSMFNNNYNMFNNNNYNHKQLMRPNLQHQTQLTRKCIGNTNKNNINASTEPLIKRYQLTP